MFYYMQHSIVIDYAIMAPTAFVNYMPRTLLNEGPSGMNGEYVVEQQRPVTELLKVMDENTATTF